MARRETGAAIVPKHDTDQGSEQDEFDAKILALIPEYPNTISTSAIVKIMFGECQEDEGGVCQEDEGGECQEHSDGSVSFDLVPDTEPDTKPITVN